MKRLILGSLIVFGLVVSAFGGVLNDETKKIIEELRQKWEYIKESHGADWEELKENECYKFCNMDARFEWLDYVDKHGLIKGRELALKKYKRTDWNIFQDGMLRGMDMDISEEYGKLEERGLLKRYNQYKGELAKCRLSGKKCVEE